MIATRPIIDADREFVVSGWSSSLRASRDIPLVPMIDYADMFRPIIERLVAMADVVVAHGELGVLMGFIAYDPAKYTASINRRRLALDGYILYCYVASPFRRRGIARRLFAAAGISPEQRFGYACRTRASWDLRAKIPLAEYEPFRARYEEIGHVRTAAEERTAEGSDSDSDQSLLPP